MSWDNSLKEEITFISPMFKKFTALWRGNERTFDTKLGLFDPPNTKGTIVQPLGAKSWQYPITAYFDGIFNNTTAEDFVSALQDEDGVWTIIHPSKGTLSLILISCKENIQPVESGGYTAVDMVWIEPANIFPALSALSLLDKISNAVVAIQDAMIIAQQLRTDAYGAVVSAINAFNQIKGFLQAIIEFPAQTISMFKTLYDDTLAELNAAIDAFDITNADPDPVYEKISAFIDCPIQVYDDFSQGFSLYDDILDSIIDTNIYGAGGVIVLNTEDDIVEALNKVKVKEYYLIAAFSAMCRAMLNATFETRPEVVTAIQNITTFFNKMILELDTMQEYFSGLDIDQQFFAQTQTYHQVYTMYADALRFLFSQIYNMKTEKRFTLTRDRSPLEITVTEYGSLGKDDEFYNKFLKSNNLSGTDIFILPAGREVVIY